MKNDFIFEAKLVLVSLLLQLSLSLPYTWPVVFKLLLNYSYFRSFSSKELVKYMAMYKMDAF